jgi:hypothetical protein
MTSEIQDSIPHNRLPHLRQPGVLCRASGLLCAAGLALLTLPGQATPDRATAVNNSCETCHVVTGIGRKVDGKFSIVAPASLDLGRQLNGRQRGQMPTYQVVPGGVVRFQFKRLDNSTPWAMCLIHFEYPPQKNSTNNIMTFKLASNTAGGWQVLDDPTNVNPTYNRPNPFIAYGPITNAVSGGNSDTNLYSVDVTIDPTTPPDVYAIEFSMGGQDATGLWYADAQCYVEVVAPELAVSQAVTWPAAYTNYLLQSSTNLNGPYTPHAADQSVVGNKKIVVIAPTGINRYFRLQQTQP